MEPGFGPNFAGVAHPSLEESFPISGLLPFLCSPALSALVPLLMGRSFSWTCTRGSPTTGTELCQTRQQEMLMGEWGNPWLFSWFLWFTVSILSFGSCSPAFLGSAGGRPAGPCSASTYPLPFRPSWCTLHTLQVCKGWPSPCVLAGEFRGLARSTGVQPLSLWSPHSQSGCPASLSLAAVPGAVWLCPAAPQWHLETVMLQP